MRIAAAHATHDSSVAVINDGKLEFFCKEERLSGVKRDGMPFFSIDKATSSSSPVDEVLYCTDSTDSYLFKQYLKKKFGTEATDYYEMKHHECHAALSYFNSGFDDALVFVIDRNGSIFKYKDFVCAREAETVFHFNNKGWKPLQKNFNLTVGDHEKNLVEKYLKEVFSCEINAKSPYGIVSTYECATTLIGQNPLENGKTMGLAAYSGKTVFEPLFDQDGVPYGNQLCADVGIELYDNKVHLGNCFYKDTDKITFEVKEGEHQFYADRAKQVQLQTQKLVLDLIRKHVQQTGIKNVCIVGGYGLNVVANNYYLEHLSDVSFYFEPVADDTGLTIGAAMLRYFQRTGNKPEPLKDNFYHYYEKEEYPGVPTTLDNIAELLSKGSSVAIFEGNPEAGPRALGHRSILMSPSSKNSKDVMNHIKKREWYRPFAGIVLEEEFNNYFETNGLTKSEYMTVSFTAKKSAIKKAPGVIHVDGTCRAQTVSSGTVYSILKKFKALSGVPILMNTSFNLAGKPLVQTVEDALWTLQNSTLDHVVFVENDKYFIV